VEDAIAGSDWTLSSKESTLCIGTNEARRNGARRTVMPSESWILHMLPIRIWLHEAWS